MMLTLLWAASAQAKLTLGVVTSAGGPVRSEAQAESLADYLGGRLGEQVKVRVFKDEPSLHNWMHRFRVVDLGLFSREYLDRLPAGELLSLGGLDGAAGRSQNSLALRQGLGKGVQSQLKAVLSGMASNDQGRQLLSQLGGKDLQAQPETLSAAAARQTAWQKPVSRPAPSVRKPATPTAALARVNLPSATPAAVPLAADGLRVGLIEGAPAVAAVQPAPVVVKAPRAEVRQEPVKPVRPMAPQVAVPPLEPVPAPVVSTFPAKPTRPETAKAVVRPTPKPVAPSVAVVKPVAVPPTAPAPKPSTLEKQKESLQQVARLEPPPPSAPVPPPPVVKPKPAPAPKPPPVTTFPSDTGLETIFVAPFLTIMVPDAVGDGVFDGFVDSLIEEGEKLGYEFIILKNGLDKVDPGWLARHGYITGEVFAYVEDSGCCSTNIRSKSRIRFYPPGQSDPEAEFEFPAKVFFDHDYSTIEMERNKLAQRISAELSGRLLQSLGPLAAKAGR